MQLLSISQPGSSHTLNNVLAKSLPSHIISQCRHYTHALMIRLSCLKRVTEAKWWQKWGAEPSRLSSHCDSHGRSALFPCREASPPRLDVIWPSLFRHQKTPRRERKMSSSAAQCASNKPVIYILELPAANSCYRSKQGPRVGLEALISAFIAAIDSSMQYHFCFVFLRKLLMTQFRFGNKMINSERWSRSVRWVDAEGWNLLLLLLWRNLVRRPHLCS